ncbi:MAG: hypothetical protein K0U98_11505 [Deltaproteobacteria bacterium]|nr:hypothetical protein [Deltaproteobacteria bacterium]
MDENSSRGRKQLKYPKLVESTRALMDSDRLRVTPASEAIAKEIAPDNFESVARHIRRLIKKEALSTGQRGSAHVGLGVLYELLSKRIESLENEALHLCSSHAQFESVARKADAIRNLVEGRRKDLEELDSNEALAQAIALLGGADQVDPVLDAKALIDREVTALNELSEEARSLQQSIDIWRLDTSYEDF